MYKAILFDLDGTLIDTNQLILDTFDQVIFNHRGSHPTKEEIKEVYGMALLKQMEHFDILAAEDLTQAYREVYRRDMDQKTHLFPGVMDLLKALKERGIPVGIITNKGRRGVEHALDKFSLRPYVDLTISADDVIRAKPHPEGIEKALSYFACQPSQALFIGDSKHDMESALAAKTPSVYVKWSIMDPEDFGVAKPSYEIESPQDLLKLL